MTLGLIGAFCTPAACRLPKLGIAATLAPGCAKSESLMRFLFPYSALCKRLGKLSHAVVFARRLVIFFLLSSTDKSGLAVFRCLVQQGLRGRVMQAEKTCTEGFCRSREPLPSDGPHLPKHSAHKQEAFPEAPFLSHKTPRDHSDRRLWRSIASRVCSRIGPESRSTYPGSQSCSLF